VDWNQTLPFLSSAGRRQPNPHDNWLSEEVALLVPTRENADSTFGVITQLIRVGGPTAVRFECLAGWLDGPQALKQAKLLVVVSRSRTSWDNSIEQPPYPSHPWGCRISYSATLSCDTDGRPGVAVGISSRLAAASLMGVLRQEAWWLACKFALIVIT
jgi:hypothetical protein